jgi:hypothetical protein
VRIVHVLRKPVVGSVARNVLDHGCGALNIDATRIAFRGETSPSVQRRASAAASGKAGRVTSGDNTQEGHVFAAARDPADALALYVTPKAGEFKGRWPANLVIEHRSGCRVVGVRELPAHTSTERGFRTAYVGGDKKEAITPQVLGDADGIDRSELWECEDGCAASELDRDTADLLPQGGPKRKNTRDSAWFGGGDPDGDFYGDSGGASRFFLQFRGGRG